MTHVQPPLHLVAYALGQANYISISHILEVHAGGR